MTYTQEMCQTIIQARLVFSNYIFETIFEDVNVPICVLNYCSCFFKLYRLTQKGTEVAYHSGHGSQNVSSNYLLAD